MHFTSIQCSERRKLLNKKWLMPSNINRKISLIQSFDSVSLLLPTWIDSADTITFQLVGRIQMKAAIVQSKNECIRNWFRMEANALKLHFLRARESIHSFPSYECTTLKFCIASVRVCVSQYFYLKFYVLMLILNRWEKTLGPWEKCSTNKMHYTQLWKQ